MSNTEQKFLDQKGVEYLWSKVSMQDYPNNEILAAVISAIDKTKADKNELVQSNWNETNKASLAFIKNKPSESDALELVAEMGFVEPIAAEDGSVYTDENGAVYTL